MTSIIAWSEEIDRELRAQGRQEGRQEGQLLTTRNAVLRLLKLRFGCEHEPRVEQCDDLAQLELWFDRAITATSVDAVFTKA